MKFIKKYTLLIITSLSIVTILYMSFFDNWRLITQKQENKKSIQDIVYYINNTCSSKIFISDNCEKSINEYYQYIEKNVITNKKINNIVKDGINNKINCNSNILYEQDNDFTIANDSNNPYCLAITMELKNMNMDYIKYSDVFNVYLNKKNQDELTAQAKNIIESIN